MKALVAVLGGLAILAAGFGVYRWLDDDEERGRAEEAAEQWAAYCKNAGGTCEVTRVESMAPGLWRFYVRSTTGGTYCRAVELENFQFSISGEEGIVDTPCGPDRWTTEEAQRRLTQSRWARERKATLIACVSRDPSGGPSMFSRRFSCRYSSPRGDGTVVLATTGTDTFELEPSL